jgi:hypothetical protein
VIRASLKRGKSGVQTVYDVFAVAPLGAGVLDTTAGSALVTGHFTGQELKHLLEFFLVDNPATLASTSLAPPACGSDTTRRAPSSTS